MCVFAFAFLRTICISLLRLRQTSTKSCIRCRSSYCYRFYCCCCCCIQSSMSFCILHISLGSSLQLLMLLLVAAILLAGCACLTRPQGASEFESLLNIIGAHIGVTPPRPHPPAATDWQIQRRTSVCEVFWFIDWLSKRLQFARLTASQICRTQ